MNNTPDILSNTKIKNDRPKVIVGILMLLALAGVSGYSAHLYWQNNASRNDLMIREQEKAALTASNAALTNELKGVKELEKPAMSDEDAVKQAAQLYLDAQKLDTNYIPSNIKIDGIFASAGVSPASLPTYVPSGLYLKKVKGQWIVIWNGQNGPDKATGERFELPKGWYDSTSR